MGLASYNYAMMIDPFGFSKKMFANLYATQDVDIK